MTPRFWGRLYPLTPDLFFCFLISIGRFNRHCQCSMSNTKKPKFQSPSHLLIPQLLPSQQVTALFPWLLRIRLLKRFLTFLFLSRSSERIFRVSKSSYFQDWSTSFPFSTTFTSAILIQPNIIFDLNFYRSLLIGSCLHSCFLYSIQIA